MILKALMDCGYVKFVCSQNIENLHRTSGIDKKKLWEVHGNIFDFECSNCKTVFDEENPVDSDLMLCPHCSSNHIITSDSSGHAEAGGLPAKYLNQAKKFTRHSGSLRRRVVRHYGENVVPPAHANYHLFKMKFCIVIGSSLKVGKIHSFVCPDPDYKRPLLVIINRDQTRRKTDNWSKSKGLRFHDPCDLVLDSVATLLELNVPAAPQVSRKLLRERGETCLDLERIFFGERKH